MKQRAVAEIITGRDGVDGAGVKLVRLFGGEVQAKKFDPFLMMDGFDSTNPDDYSKGFPWHPHRGIETITYLIEGRLEHRDSLGTVGVINSGDAQWMSAGSGIIHQEMPQPAKRMLGIQLWLNLPSKHKMSSPHYADILSNNIPEVSEGDNTIRVVAGKYGTTKGAFSGKYVDPQFLDVELAAKSDWSLPTSSGDTVFIYIVQGSISLADSSEIAEKQVVLTTDGEELNLTAGSDGARLLVFCATPIHEPIAWGGPVVMNTQAELEQAFIEMQYGTFIKPDTTPK